MSEERRPDDPIPGLDLYNRPPLFPRDSLQAAILDERSAGRRRGSERSVKYARGAAAVAAAVAIFFGGVLVGRTGVAGPEDRVAVSEQGGSHSVEQVSAQLAASPGDAPHQVIWF